MRSALLVPLFILSTLPGCKPETAEKTTPPKTESPKPAPLKTMGMEAKAVEALLERRVMPNFVPGDVVVKMKPAAKLQPMSAADLKRMNLEIKREQTSGGEIVYSLPQTTVRALSAKDRVDRTLAAVKSLSARPDVEYAQPNFIFQITATPNDTGYPRQWHYFDNGTGPNQAPGGISLPQAWDVSQGSSSVVVAVIDTGILPGHEDITGSPNLIAGFDMISDPAIANDGDGRDAVPTDPGDAIVANECFPGSPPQPDSWHGTHVAGTIGVGKTNNGLGVAGINWSVKVQAVRVLGKCGGTMVDINDAIRWAAGLPVPGVPNNPTPAKVINMSLGGASPCSASPATQSAINDAIARGVTVVVAAGNEAQDAAGFIPASCNGVITVAAGDWRGHLVQRYSNFGARVDIMAPGGDVRRDDDNDGNPDGVLSMVNGGYEFYNGTSMAAPHVAGVAALLLAQDATRTPAQILALLKNNALPRTAAQCPQPCGAGLLNARVGPPPPPPVAITLAPTDLRITIGQSAEVTATVKRNSTAEAGKTVTFASSDTAIATVAPSSAVTDVNGTAKVTVRAVASGTATLRAESQGGRASAAITVPKPAPALPLGVVALFVLAALAFYGWRALRSRGA